MADPQEGANRPKQNSCFSPQVLIDAYQRPNIHQKLLYEKVKMDSDEEFCGIDACPFIYGRRSSLGKGVVYQRYLAENI